MGLAHETVGCAPSVSVQVLEVMESLDKLQSLIAENGELSLKLQSRLEKICHYDAKAGETNKVPAQEKCEFSERIDNLSAIVLTNSDVVLSILRALEI
jgi:hypothetical protein